MNRFLLLIVAALSMNASAQVAMMYKDDIPGDTLVCVTNWGPYVAVLEARTNGWNAAVVTNALQTARLGSLESGTNGWNAAYGHTLRTDNPHSVTPEQIGAATAEQGATADAALPQAISAAQLADSVNGALSNHMNDDARHIMDGERELWNTALQPAATGGVLRVESDPVAMAALATNRVTTTWDTNGHWYVESGDTRTEYWVTNGNYKGWELYAPEDCIFNGSGSYTVLSAGSHRVTGLPFPRLGNGDFFAVSDSVNILYDGSTRVNLEVWGLDTDDLYGTNFVMTTSDPHTGYMVLSYAVRNYLVATNAFTNSITRYISAAPPLTAETWSYNDQANWQAVAGTNWVDNLILGWWFYERSYWVDNNTFGETVDNLQSQIHGKVSIDGGTLTNATLAGVTRIGGVWQFGTNAVTLGPSLSGICCGEGLWTNGVDYGAWKSYDGGTNRWWELWK